MLLKENSHYHSTVFMLKGAILLFINAFLCVLAFVCFVFMSSSIVILAIFLTFPYIREVWLTIKQS